MTTRSFERDGKAGWAFHPTLHWCSYGSCNMVITQKYRKCWVTSWWVFGLLDFLNYEFACSLSIYRCENSQQTILGGVVYEYIPFKRLLFKQFLQGRHFKSTEHMKSSRITMWHVNNHDNQINGRLGTEQSNGHQDGFSIRSFDRNLFHWSLNWKPNHDNDRIVP